MGFRVGFASVTGIGVQNDVVLGINKNLHGWAFWGFADRRVFEPGVTSADRGRVQLFCSFVLLVLVSVVDSVDNRGF